MTRFIIAATLLILAVFAINSPTVYATEKPDYTVVMEDDKFEIREYPSMLIAEVTVMGDRKTAANLAFKKLAGFIFGDNQSRSKVAMTSPVTQTPAAEKQSEKIAMTAPVVQTQTETGIWIVNFMMPSEYTMETLPVPDDKDITIRETDPYTFGLPASGNPRPCKNGPRSSKPMRLKMA